MKHFISYYLLPFTIVILFVTFVIPSIRVYRKTRVNPMRFKSTGNAHDYTGKIMMFLMLVRLALIALYTFTPYWYAYTMPVFYMEYEVIRWTGFLLLHLAFIWVSVAQYQMSDSWRIGIDDVNNTSLVTHGLFGWSRNPVFLGIVFAMISVFLMLPNMVTFALTLSTYFIIQVQIRLEEAFLLTEHGLHFTAYRARVRRFI